MMLAETPADLGKILSDYGTYALIVAAAPFVSKFAYWSVKEFLKRYDLAAAQKAAVITALDARNEKITDTNAANITAILNVFKEEIHELTGTFKEEIGRERASCEKRLDKERDLAATRHQEIMGGLNRIEQSNRDIATAVISTNQETRVTAAATAALLKDKLEKERKPA